jgi:hypothetical protein
VPGIRRKPTGSFLKFAQELEKRFVGRGEEGTVRSLERARLPGNRCRCLPLEILTRAREADLAKHRHGERGTEAA